MPTRRQTLEFEICRGVTIFNNHHPDIKKLMSKVDGHSHHGDKVWNTSRLLMDYFAENPLPVGCRVLEIGCGWGLTGIYLATHFRCDVTAVDIDQNVFPFLQLHAEVNGVDIDCIKSSYDKLSVDFLKTFDLVIGGDICFWDELTRKLFKVMKRSMTAKTRVVLADPGRQPFYQLVERAGKLYTSQYLERNIKQPKYRGYILDMAAD